MTVGQVECPQCSVVVSDTDRFCERCGAVLSGILRTAIPRGAPALEGTAGRCSDCGNEIHADGYCTVCG